MASQIVGCFSRPDNFLGQPLISSAVTAGDQDCQVIFFALLSRWFNARKNFI